ncbi:uncharacterized protein LOC115925172 [Strongylocentrotus purpuratus]|uniref:P2X purinoreceptor 7 intracellular domain-containing protein n=1 Tax=Strongylocentrotus purpuratus TaxID=7668 RepID=A0A7M7P0Z2_STRPU|nr:uncharacterized protein LOC115925172 [Strongylocentrotus purpuratus]
MATPVVRADAQDDLVMEFECEEDGSCGESGENDSVSGSSDSLDSTGSSSDTDSDASDADAGEHGRIVEWEYEPLPRGEPGQNVGDAGRANNANRLHENVEDWCTCGRCRVPPSFNEGDCVCCQEIAEVKAEADRQGSSCLVDSEEFEPAILNATTLYIGWMEYTDRWRRAAKAFGDRNNEKYRYVAYRKVVRWCWGWLGKDIRVQLPACVHASIMEAYPDGRGQYKGTILRRLR